LWHLGLKRASDKAFRGSVTGIAGESGSGKTTLARIMSGLLQPSTGYVAFDGIRVDTLNKAAERRLRRQLRYVHQDPAAALDPRLVVLDEPSAGLDLLVRASLLTLLDDLRARLGLTHVIVTHDFSVVDALRDEVAVTYRGRVVEHGATREVLDRPAHPYTRELMASLPRLDGPRVIDAIALRVRDDISGWSPTACAFLSRCPMALQVCAAARPRQERRRDRATACWNQTPE